MATEPKANRGPSAGPDNRLALINAARDVFAESGFSAPLSSIAKRAGVGQGSLYRHFPDRVSLATAVFDDNINELEAIADRPDASLGELVDAIADQAMGSAALIDMFASNRHDGRVRHLETRVTTVVETVLARENGIRESVTSDDVMLAISMLAFALSKTDEADRPAVAARARALFGAAFRK